MLDRNSPRILRVPQPRQLLPFLVVGCPMLRLTVWGDDSEHADHPVPFPMHDRAARRNRAVRHCAIARPVGIDPSVRLQPSQPAPATIPDQAHAAQRAPVHARIPTVAEDAFRRAAARLSGQERGEAMLILADAVMRLVVDTVIDRDATLLAPSLCTQLRNSYDEKATDFLSTRAEPRGSDLSFPALSSSLSSVPLDTHKLSRRTNRESGYPDTLRTGENAGWRSLTNRASLPHPFPRPLRFPRKDLFFGVTRRSDPSRYSLR